MSIALYASCEVKVLLHQDNDCGCSINSIAQQPAIPQDADTEKNTIIIKADWKFIVEKLNNISCINSPVQKLINPQTNNNYKYLAVETIFHPPVYTS